MMVRLDLICTEPCEQQYFLGMYLLHSREDDLWSNEILPSISCNYIENKINKKKKNIHTKIHYKIYSKDPLIIDIFADNNNRLVPIYQPFFFFTSRFGSVTLGIFSL